MILIDPSKELKDTTTDSSRIHANWVFAEALKDAITEWGDACMLSRSSETADAGDISDIVKRNNVSVMISVDCQADIGSDVKGYAIDCNKLTSLVTTLSYVMHRKGLTCIYSRGYKETNKNLVSKLSDIDIYLGYITNDSDAEYLLEDDFLQSLAVDMIDACYGPPVRTYEEELEPANADPYFYSSTAWTEDEAVDGFSGDIKSTTYQGLPIRYLEITGKNVDSLSTYTWSIPLSYTENKSCYFMASIQAAEGEVTGYIKVSSKEYTFTTSALDFTTKNILVDVAANSRVYIGIQGPGTIRYSGVWVSEVGTLGTLDDPRMDYSIFPPGYRTEVVSGAYTNTDALTITITNAASFMERASEIIETKVKTAEDIEAETNAAIAAECSGSTTSSSSSSSSSGNTSSSFTNLTTTVNSLTSSPSSSSSSDDSSGGLLSSITSKALTVASDMLIASAGVTLANMKNSDNTQSDTKDLSEYNIDPSKLGDAAASTLGIDMKTAISSHKRMAVEAKSSIDAAKDSHKANTEAQAGNIKAEKVDPNSAESGKSEDQQKEEADSSKAGSGLITDTVAKAMEEQKTTVTSETNWDYTVRTAYKEWSEWFTGWTVDVVELNGLLHRYVTGSDGNKYDFDVYHEQHINEKRYILKAVYATDELSDSVVMTSLQEGLSTPPLMIYGMSKQELLKSEEYIKNKTAPDSIQCIPYTGSNLEKLGEQFAAKDAKMYKKAGKLSNPKLWYQYVGYDNLLANDGDLINGPSGFPNGIHPDLSKSYTVGELKQLANGTITTVTDSGSPGTITKKTYTTAGTISSGEVTNKGYFKLNNNTLIYETLTATEKDEFIASGTLNNGKLDDGKFELNLVKQVDLNHNLPKDIVDQCLLAEGTTNTNTEAPEAYKITKAEQRKRKEITKIEDKTTKKAAQLGQTASDTIKALQEKQNAVMDKAKSAADSAKQLQQKNNILMQVSSGVLSAAAGIAAITAVVTTAVTSVTSVATAAIGTALNAVTTGVDSLIKKSLGTLTDSINKAAATKETLTPKLDVKASVASKQASTLANAKTQAAAAASGASGNISGLNINTDTASAIGSVKATAGGAVTDVSKISAGASAGISGSV